MLNKFLWKYKGDGKKPSQLNLSVPMISQLYVFWPRSVPTVSGFTLLPAEPEDAGI